MELVPSNLHGLPHGLKEGNEIFVNIQEGNVVPLAL
jgi:hypothetical protein